MSKWLKDARTNPLFRWTLGFAGLAFVLDQASKLWILHGLKLPQRPFGHFEISGIFDLHYVENRGVSFGMFAGGMSSRILLTLLAIVVSGFVIHWAARLDRKVAAVGAGLIVGGALGNAIDRVFYGFVVDFLDFRGLYFPWQFNIADTAINLGVACLVFDAFFGAEKPQTSGGNADTTSQSLSAEPEANAPVPADDTKLTKTEE